MKLLLQKGLQLALESIGYDSIYSAFNQIFLMKSKLITISILLFSVLSGVFIFIENWIFSPAITYYTFVVLSLAESIAGTLRATIINHEKFNFEKALRIIPKILSHTFCLSAAWYMSKSDPVLSWMPSTVFIYFSTHNFIKTVIHLVELKYVEGDFADFIRKKFDLK